MNTSRMADGYLNEAEEDLQHARLSRARESWATAVRHSQEAVEFAVKAALRSAAVEPLRTHDPADQLRAAEGRFPEAFRVHIARIAAVANELATDRGPAFYGDEEAEIPPNELFGKDQGERAVAAAEMVVEHCARLIRPAA